MSLYAQVSTPKGRWPSVVVRPEICLLVRTHKRIHTTLSLLPQINVPGDLTAFARAYNGKDSYDFDCEVEAKGEPNLG